MKLNNKIRGGIKLNNLQEAAIKEYVNSIIKTYEDMYLDQRKKYSLDFKTEYIETKQMGYENRLDLDRILLELETPPVKLEVGA